MKQKQISIIGCGWLGLALAKVLIAKGWVVKGTTTDIGKLPILEKIGIDAYFLHITPANIKGEIIKVLEGSDYLILNYPPKRLEGIEKTYPQTVAKILPFIAEQQKVIFVSSTSVYQNNNNWVAENLTCQPEKKSGCAVLGAEKILQKHLLKKICILRFSGLIGGERMPAKFLAGKRNLKGGNAPVNLIHREDCIGLILQIIAKDFFGEVVNGCSDEHPLRKNFYTKAAENLSLPMPIFTPEQNANFKWVDNTKSKELLGYVYKHPDPSKLI